MVLIEDDMLQHIRRGPELNHLAAHRADGKFQPGVLEQLRAPGAGGDNDPSSVVFPPVCPDPLNHPTPRDEPKDGRVLVNGDAPQMQG